MTAPSAGAEERGSLVIDDRVVERVAAHAVSSVEHATAAPRRVLGISVGEARPDDEPSVTASVQGGLATVQTTIAVAWPQPIPTVVDQLRRKVCDEVQRTTGVHVDQVDVEVTQWPFRPSPLPGCGDPPMTLLNRVLSALLALAMLIGGLIVAIEAVLALLGRPHWLVPHQEWTAWLDEQTWESTTVRTVCATAVLVGLLLLLVAARRGKPSILTLQGGAQTGVHVSASRRGVESPSPTSPGEWRE